MTTTKQATETTETAEPLPKIGDVIDFTNPDLLHFRGQIVDMRAPGVAYVAVFGYATCFPVMFRFPGAPTAALPWRSNGEAAR